VIELTSVTKRFHTLVAVDRLSLKIGTGEVIGVLGPNGAGKTTLFKLIAGILMPDEGQVQPAGSGWPALGYKPERLLFPGDMRVSTYLTMVCRLANLSRSQLSSTVQALLEQVNLTAAAGKRVRDCSKGMRQRLALAQALVGDPPVLLLDEPTSGLDPEGQADICSQIQALYLSGKTIVLASHQLHEVTQICTRIIILHNGRIHFESQMAEALAPRPHARITLSRPADSLRPLLTSLHPGVDVTGSDVSLSGDAVVLRRQVLSLLLAAGYDVVGLEQHRISLAEIYARVVQ
jgi:ABC-2 type transport system ATP-binding protein